MQQANWIDALLAMPWVAWSVGGLLLALSVFLLWRFLFADRSRGRRCPKCWYDLRGTQGLRCSECGYEARHEKALLRRRRRWGAGGAALLLLAAGVGVLIAPTVRKSGWFELVPTTVLLWLAPPCNGGDDYQPQPWAAVELGRRNAAASLTDWQWRYVLLHKGGLRFRESWPAGIPLVVDAIGGSWCGDWIFSLEELAPCRAIDWRLDAWRLKTDALRIGEKPVIDLRIESGPVMFTIPGMPIIATSKLWAGKVELPIRVVATVDEVMTRRSGEEFDQLMRRALQLQLSFDEWPSDWSPDRPFHRTVERNRVHCVTLVMDRSVHQQLKNVASGFQVVFRKNGKMVETVPLHPELEALQHPMLTENAHSGVSVSYSALRDVRAADLRDFSDWTVEIRGNPAAALRDWERSEFWDGTIILRPDEIWIEGRDPWYKRRGWQRMFKRYQQHTGLISCYTAVTCDASNSAI